MISVIGAAAAMATLVTPAQAGMRGCDDITCIAINGGGMRSLGRPCGEITF